MKLKQFGVVLAVLLVLGLGLAFMDAAGGGGGHAAPAGEAEETVEQH